MKENFGIKKKTTSCMFSLKGRRAQKEKKSEVDECKTSLGSKAPNRMRVGVKRKRSDGTLGL